MIVFSLSFPPPIKKRSKKSSHEDLYDKGFSRYHSSRIPSMIGFSLDMELLILATNFHRRREGKRRGKEEKKDGKRSRKGITRKGCNRYPTFILTITKLTVVVSCGEGFMGKEGTRMERRMQLVPLTDFTLNIPMSYSSWIPRKKWG